MVKSALPENSQPRGPISHVGSVPLMETLNFALKRFAGSNDCVVLPTSLHSMRRPQKAAITKEALKASAVAGRSPVPLNVVPLPQRPKAVAPPAPGIASPPRVQLHFADPTTVAVPWQLSFQSYGDWASAGVAATAMTTIAITADPAHKVSAFLKLNIVYPRGGTQVKFGSVEKLQTH